MENSARQFLDVSLGSLSEVESERESDLGNQILTQGTQRRMNARVALVRRMLNSLRSRLAPPW
jgi:hypothetical protein